MKIQDGHLNLDVPGRYKLVRYCKKRFRLCHLRNHLAKIADSLTIRLALIRVGNVREFDKDAPANRLSIFELTLCRLII